MDDDPAKLIQAMDIARKCLRIVREKIVFALAVKGLLPHSGRLGRGLHVGGGVRRCGGGGHCQRCSMPPGCSGARAWAPARGAKDVPALRPSLFQSALSGPRARSDRCALCSRRRCPPCDTGFPQVRRALARLRQLSPGRECSPFSVPLENSGTFFIRYAIMFSIYPLCPLFC